MANLITLCRIALVIPFAAAFTVNAPWNMSAALAIFIIASLTDFVDGRVARARGETSALGAALDPLADKLLVAAALILLVRNGVVRGPEVYAAMAIVLRELTVSGLREAVGARAASLPVTTLAKWKTMLQLLAVAVLIAGAPNGPLAAYPDLPARPAGAALLWLASALTVWTGALYALEAFRILSGRPPPKSKLTSEIRETHKRDGDATRSG